MRHIRPAGLGLFLLLTQAGISQSPQPAPAVPLVPTTKILAIGATKATLTPEQRALILPHEVPGTVQLYLSGKIDQWWVRQDGKGVVFLMNVTSVEV